MTALPVAAASVRLTALSIRSFRNIARADVEFPAAGAVIVGDNGQGKTSVLEALGFLGTLRSIRNARDKDLVQHGAPAAHLRACIDDGRPREVGIGIDRVSGRKKITIDGVEVMRHVDALGMLPAVSWSPGDVSLVGGGPAERRRYLDIMLALSSRRYVHALRQYRAALDRRNASIRDAARRGTGEGTVAAWEPALAEHGATLVDDRRLWVREHQSEFARVCSAIGEHAAASLEYESDAADADDARERILALLAQSRVRDIQRGMTCAGPHRDDLGITLDGHDARVFGSAGQQRTAAIALRLLEARTLQAHDRGRPALLLDDPFAELDATRSERTLALLVAEEIGQVILAVPREDEIPAHFRSLSRWRISNGVITT